MERCQGFSRSHCLKRSYSERSSRTLPRSLFSHRRVSADDCCRSFLPPDVEFHNKISMPGNPSEYQYSVSSTTNTSNATNLTSLAIPSSQNSPKDPLRGSTLTISGFSPNNSCISSVGPICRICLEGDNQEDLISPCRCTGSMAKVHKTCLERWLNLSNGDKCELCHYTFTVNRTPRPFWQFVMCDNREARRSAVIDFICMLILTPLAAVALYLCITSIVYYTKHNNAGRTRTVVAHTVIMEKDFKQNKSMSIDEEHLNFIAWDIVGLVILACLLIGIYMSWLLAALTYHLKVWQRWRHLNSDLVLVESHRRPSRFSVLSNTYQQMSEIESPESFTVTSRRISVAPTYSAAYVPCIRTEDVDSYQLTSEPEEKLNVAYGDEDSVAAASSTRAEELQCGHLHVHFATTVCTESGESESTNM